ncbi:4-hydroxythreonine-4-phosphate dehydrogenase PdxA [Parachitinimonas caeni]|uniref:4-hydroxythreonine-4-phosphate dehydrogenase n=1 Tax=Parachitinimonas caeni TaxID=3031301 RepID=A0ABT7DQZ2_9NEIS|nr:4-hydroxythreonine-4-phosphate dehydrogenase PdxA [Parachitinimonas caeni]MDK2122490.1 4-hydroxythreonine-4-phosphate dehydrogenase PdxA [Parachitinimonas caeni]
MPTRSRPVIAITAGEPAGIGPDLLATLDPTRYPARLVLLADQAMLRTRAQQLGVTPPWVPYSDLSPPIPSLEVLDLPLAKPCQPGVLDTANAAQVLQLLDRACDGCLSGEFAAMVTAPLHKGVINDAALLPQGFSGHTEYLAERTHTPQVVMMLAGAGMRVALATTHLPLAQVPAAIQFDSLITTLQIIHQELQQKFGIPHPRILVAGLNPHAGEGGHLGREEIEVISPALAQLRQQGMNLIGPLPADTLFNPAQLAQGDAVLAMYHDQGLPVLKHASFGHGINITLGLPIIRTSVDHGTALDLAATGRADGGSLHAAIDLAIDLANRRN